MMMVRNLACSTCVVFAWTGNRRRQTARSTWAESQAASTNSILPAVQPATLCSIRLWSEEC